MKGWRLAVLLWTGAAALAALAIALVVTRGSIVVSLAAMGLAAGLVVGGLAAAPGEETLGHGTRE